MDSLTEKYKTAQMNIETNADLKNRIAEYRRTHLALQRRSQNQPLSFDEERMISSMYWSLMLNEDAKNLLESERFIINRAYEKMEEMCEGIDFSFLQ